MDKFELRDNESLGSNVVRFGRYHWKIVLAAVVALAIPPLVPVFLGIGIYLLIKDL